jgi:aryl-phospho-beta-D-glucosidase BglC (GH1 family)
LLHILLAKCCERNILVLLDFHKCGTGEIEELFSEKYPESRVMECHRIMCHQYANNYNCVFGIEVKNEPHIKDVSTWEKPNSTGAHWDTGPEHL